MAQDVSELMSDIEPDAIRAARHGVDDARQENDVLSPQEPGGEGIHDSIAVLHEHRGVAGHAELLATGDQLLVQIRKLVRGDFDRIATQVSDSR